MKFCSNCGARVAREVPAGDNRERWVCERCRYIHYENPKIVVGCVPEQDGKILLCRRAIEPRRGYWTVPAGFMELGETLAQGAARETLEEACADVRIGHFFASVDVLDAGQVHVFFTAELVGDHRAGEESLETKLFPKSELPWDEIAFKSGVFALKRYLDDAGRNLGVHHHTLSRSALSGEKPD
ncbi:MAG: NUDIX hydrolase [Pseudomonadota bacterium]